MNKLLTLQEVEIIRQAKLALFVADSIKKANREANNHRSRRTLYGRGKDDTSVIPIRERVHLSAVMPERVPASKAIGELPKVGIHPSKTSYKGGNVYPRAAARSITVVTKAGMLKAGLPEELVEQILKSQATRIRIPRNRVADCQRIRLMLASDDDNIRHLPCSMKEALEIADKVETN